MGDFPCIPPIVSFTGLIVGTGHSSLRRDLLPGLGAAQLNCCGFVRLSTYVAPGMPNKVPFKGFHPFQVFVIFPVRANPWAILCRKMAERQDSQFQPNVAGLLRHDVMLYPGLGPGQRLYRRPGFLDFLDKAAAAVTTMAPLLSTPQRQQASSASAAFRDVRAASLSLITPGTLPLSPPPLASASPSTGHLTPPGKRYCPEPADTPTKRPCLLHKAPPASSATHSFSVSAASAAHEPDNLSRVLTYGLFLDSIVAHGLGSPAHVFFVPQGSLRNPVGYVLESPLIGDWSEYVLSVGVRSADADAITPPNEGLTACP
ncbi:hypothetical protein HRG_012978 [Hirsutella rhossiliensis]